MNKIFKCTLISLFTVIMGVSCASLFGCGGNSQDKGTGEKTEEETTEQETYVDYSLKDFVYSVSGVADVYLTVDEMSSTDHFNYDSVIMMYGKNVKISDKNIEFVDGTVLSIYGKTGYKLDGEDVIFSETALTQTFNNVKLSNGLFSIGIQIEMGGIDVSYCFNYYSPNYVPPTYEVSFDTQGGSIVYAKTVTSGETVTRPSDPAKAGYVLVAWYTDENYTYVWNFENDKVYSNITLYAKWNPKRNTIKFNSNGGSPVETEYVYTGNTVSEPSKPYKDGYVFGGWYTNSALTRPYDFNTIVTDNLTLYARWVR